MVSHTAGDALGVRETIDITPIDGLVHPRTGGMSVSPSKKELPGHLIAKRLRKQGYPQARRGNDRPETHPWRLGVGPFVSEPLCDKLQLRVDPSHPTTHAFVEPDASMPLDEHRRAIEATKRDWVQEPWLAGEAP